MDGDRSQKSQDEALWKAMPVAERIARVCALRHALANDPQPFIEAARTRYRRNDAETLAAEIIPLADACKFLECQGARILASRNLGRRGKPLWLWGVQARVDREPWGRVLIIGPGNYPLMLPGIQAIQALVAGNCVLIKPAPHCAAPMKLLANSLYGLGVPRGALEILNDDAQAGRAAMDSADKVFLTGSEETGRAVLADLADRMIPGVLELSGCDAAFVLRDADIDLAARAIAFGLTFNSSATCMAPRRIFVHDAVADDLGKALARRLTDVSPMFIGMRSRTLLNELGKGALESGATLLSGEFPVGERIWPVVLDHCRPSMRLLQEDIMATVSGIVRVASNEEALAASRECRYALGASIFSKGDDGRTMAARVDAGCVVVNDMIAPTADPRMSFGGWGRSGFGVTRGVDGLLEMTRAKTVIVRRGGATPHLQPPTIDQEQLLREFLRASNAKKIRHRLGAWRRVMMAGKRMMQNRPDRTSHS